MLGKNRIIEFLSRHSIDRIFHLPGIHTLPLNQALFGRDIALFVGRHESNCAFMAEGFARASGQAGVVIVTPGPGLGNTVSPVMEAYGNDTPLMVLHVDTERAEIGKGILHELVDPEGIFTHFTKGTFFAANPADLSPLLERAYRLATTGRPGPVLLSIPYTVFEKEAPESLSTPESKAQAGGTGDLSGVEEAFRGKKRPVLIVGRSAMIPGIESVLEDICVRSNIPLFAGTSGKGVVREDSGFAFGNIMQQGLPREVIASADLVVAVGTRLRDVDAKRRGVKISELVHIDVDDAWIGRNYPARVTVTGDLRQALLALRDLCKGWGFDWDFETLKARQAAEEARLAALSEGFKAVRCIRDVIPEDAITVWDLNLLGYWAEYHFPAFHQRSFLMGRGISPIFYGFPAAIGAKIGAPGHPCLAVCGDGGALPALSELATLRQYDLPVVLLVLNNNAYGILDDYMDFSYGMKGSMGLVNPDFMKLADSFGIKGARAQDTEELRQVFLEKVTWDEPFLIEFNRPVFPPPWRL
jgi:thiamine pyrophosphate-dependent acetolactate synthase large subunit-like protein